MNLKMFHVLIILIIYGVDTQSVKCPESCSCLQLFVSNSNIPPRQILFEGRNFTESGLDENFRNYRLALARSVETNQMKLSSENGFFHEEKNKSKGGSSPPATATTLTPIPVPAANASGSQPPFSSDNPTSKKCLKTLPKETVKDILVSNFLSKTVNNSKEMRTKRTLKLNVKAMEKAKGSQAEGNESLGRVIPGFFRSGTETDDEGMTEGDADEGENKWKSSEGRKSGGIFSYEITCEGVRDMKPLRLEYLANGTSRLTIRNTHFESFRVFRKVLRESPVKFDRLAVLSLTDNVINQDSNGGNSESDEETADLEAENHGGGKSRSENGEEFLPFASLQNPKLRSSKSSSEGKDSIQLKAKFKNVRILNLANNTISFLPQNAFRWLQNVEILNLSNNLIDSIGNDTLTPLINLVELDLSRNRLSAVSEVIFRNLTKLVYLDLSNNAIGCVAPSTFQYLTSLVLLNLASNQLAEKEESVAFLLGTGKRLQIVDVSRTGLKQIPGTLERSVRALNLMGNYLPSIRCGDLDSYSLLSYLNLRNNKISYVEDDALGRLELLGNLQIGENSLFQIPKSLPNNLEILNLSYNNIENITNFDFLNLSLLKELSMSNNQIGSIEANAFDNLNQLRVLDLSHNPILILPNIYGLSKLTTLNLSYFTNIPRSNSVSYKQFPIQSPETITKLNLESSPLLTSVFLQDTKTLQSFTKLEELNVRFSNLTTMRKDIFSLLPKIKLLKVEGNPWHCGDEILMLSEWLKSHKRENLLEEQNEINTAHCSTPAYLYKTSLIQLEQRHFQPGEDAQPKKNQTTQHNRLNYKDSSVSGRTLITDNLAKNHSRTSDPSPVDMASANVKNSTKFYPVPPPRLGPLKTSSQVEKLISKNYPKTAQHPQILPGPKTSQHGGIKGNFTSTQTANTDGTLQRESTVTLSPPIQRKSAEVSGRVIGNENSNLPSAETEANGRIMIGWNDNSSHFGIPVRNSLDAKRSGTSHRRGIKGKAEAVTAKDSLSLEKEYNTHLSFFILSSVGLVAMATLTFTSVYFSRNRRDQSYQRQNQDIEVCSISSIGNELW